MRLVQPLRSRTQADEVAGLRDVGGRLAYLVERYGRLIQEMAHADRPAEMEDALELMAGQVAYLAKRLQEIMVVDRERRMGYEEDDPRLVDIQVRLERLRRTSSHRRTS